MTVNWHCFIFFSVLFIESVCGVQHTLLSHSAGPTCTCPYSCVTTSECVGRHVSRALEEVLFHCGEKGKKVCCPPVNKSKGFNRRETANKEFGDNCTVIDESNQGRYPEPSGEIPVRNFSDYKAPEISSENEYFLVPQSSHVNVNDNTKNQQKLSKHGIRRPTNPLKAVEPSTRPPLDITLRPPFGGSIKPLANYQMASIHARPQIKSTKNSLTSHRNFRLLPSEANCGVSTFANRITEGEEVSLGEYPWMVLTGLTDRYGNIRWNCGGTLINGWYVLTAAHCLTVDNRTIEYVRLGEHNLTNETDCFREVCIDPAVDIRIAEVIPHERWNATAIKNDIALLRLASNPLLLGKSNIYPICLPIHIDKLNITATSKYEVAGWGKIDWNADEGSDVLRKGSITGVNREECNICKGKKMQQYCPITEFQMCVQGWKSVDVCKGDSGGPLMLTRLNIYQIGITSFKGSEYCGAENIPSIFTRVESYLPWILDNIRE